MNPATWSALAAVTLLWAGSGFLAVRHLRCPARGWRVVPLSLFGFAWIAFGAIFILRFFALLYDPVLFQASLFPPWMIPASSLTRAWVWLGAYWCSFCLGLAIMLAVVPRRLPRLLGKLGLLDAPQNVAVLDLIVFSTTTVLVLTSFMGLPSALTTPIGHFCSLWVVPAALAWHMHFRGARIGARRFAYLVPGLAMFVLSPYREHLLGAFLCIALPAVQLKPRIGLLRILAVTAAILLASSVLLYVYRPVRWEGEDLSKTKEYVSPQLWRDTPGSAPWSKLITRFHGFDSAALTIWLVPGRFPFEDRQIPRELLVGAFLPRAVYADKASVQRGRLFSTSIWAYDEYGETPPRASAMIAPSMPGDLWSSGGAMVLVTGALAWGVIVGLLESWRRILSPAGAIALVAFMALRVAGGIERDFVHATASVIQLVIVLLLVLAALPLAARRPEHAPRRGDRPLSVSTDEPPPSRRPAIGD
jgi:hypothetical protein